jgi:hypothetical protein
MVNYILDKHCLHKLKVGVLNYRYHVDVARHSKQLSPICRSRLANIWTTACIRLIIWSRLTF